MARVELDGVTKRFGETIAVDDVTLEIADEEFFVLLGPSGCGKSTILRMIAGLVAPSSGRILIGGEDVTTLRPAARDIAMVFQSYALYPHMTVRRNIEFPLRARHIRGAERDRLVDGAAQAVDLVDCLDRRPGQLSGGQRQRVALARAIVRDPQAFLMDEPLSNLDAKLRAQTRAELTALRHRLRATVVYVTHDQIEAMTMGDRIAVIVGGKVLQVGKPRSVYDEPANVTVARFIGSPPMNTIDATVAADGRVVLASDAGVVPATIAGVRPEHIALRPEGTPGLPAQVEAIESLGYENHVHCRLRDGQVMIARTSSTEMAVIIGMPVVLSVEHAAWHTFDRVSGVRL